MGTNHKENHRKDRHAAAAGHPPDGTDAAASSPAAGEGTNPDAVAAVTLSRGEYDALCAKAAERDALQDKYVRAHAEFENARKRIEKEKADYLRYATDGLIMELLPVVDNLELSEKYIKEAKDFKAVQQGLDMIHLQIQKLLKDIGIERIKTVGELFDPHLHDPLEVVETDDKDNVVVGELKPGYRMNGRLLRPASVRIAKKKADA